MWMVLCELWSVYEEMKNGKVYQSRRGKESSVTMGLKERKSEQNRKERKQKTRKCDGQVDERWCWTLVKHSHSCKYVKCKSVTTTNACLQGKRKPFCTTTRVTKKGICAQSVKTNRTANQETPRKHAQKMQRESGTVYDRKKEMMVYSGRGRKKWGTADKSKQPRQ